MQRIWPLTSQHGKNSHTLKSPGERTWQWMDDFQIYPKMADSVQYPWMSRQQNGEWIFWRCSVFIMFSSNTWKTMMCGVNFTFNNNSWTKKSAIFWENALSYSPISEYVARDNIVNVIFIYKSIKCIYCFEISIFFLRFIFDVILWMPTI